MADNVPITAGSGTTIATDDVAGVHYQRVKLVDGALEGTGAIGGDAANGLDVDVTRLPALVAGSANIGDVDVLTMPAPLGPAGAASIAKAEDSASADLDVGVPAMAVRKAAPANTSGLDGDYEMLQMSAGRLWTSAALEAGTANIGDVDVLTLPALVAGSANIGDVDVLTVPAPLSTSGGGTEATALRVTLASDSTGLVSVDDNGASLTVDGTVNATAAGDIAHDAADSGNPVKIGAKADSSIKGATMVADLDRTDLIADVDGVLLVKHMCPQTDIVNERVTDTGGTSTAFTNFSAVASTRNYVTTIVVYNSSATAGFLDLRDGTAGAVLMTIPLPAGGGAVICLPVPLRQPTANTALAYDVSAALTTVYISLVGFRSKA